MVGFHGLPLLAAPGRVMTPRPVTERLVAAAVALASGRRTRIVDVGTGSGAIAAAVASALPEASVVATDTSRDAVLLARANVARLGLAGRVDVVACDLLEGVEGSFDVIVANLPYLSCEEADRDPALAGEPRAAVSSPGDGLEAYRRLVATARERLRDGGALAIQLRRRALVAPKAELGALVAALTPVRQAA